MPRRRALWLIAAVACATALHAQGPAFDVASVKPNDTGPLGPVWMIYEPGGVMRVVNVALDAIIARAYDVPLDQLVGPDWIRTARFDILAKADPKIPAPTPEGTVNTYAPMMRSLLAERFHLVVHHDTKALPRYRLVLARADGRLGPGIQRSTEDCAPIDEARRRASSLDAVFSNGICSARQSNGAWVGNAVPIGSLATFLTTSRRFAVDRDVVDGTGLTGRFNIRLALDTSANAASIFTELEDQLGLKLQPSSVPSDIVVIDHVEPLIEN